MTNWFFNIYYSLIIVGIILVLCTLGTSTSSALTGTMTGYSFIVSGILLLIGYIMNKIYTANPKGSFLTILFSIGPFLMIVGIIIYILYLLGTYFNRITNGNVSSGYVAFSNIAVVLILLQVILFYNGTKDPSFVETSTLSRVSNMLLYLLGVLNVIVVITLGVILAYFSTDG
jgi:hypothetical protein